MDSFHECLQEYGEGLEVVQICLEPEEPSIKDDLSILGDLSFEDCKKTNEVTKMNGINERKSSKSDSMDEHDDDMTITEDDILTTPRELPDLRIKIEKGDLIKQQSKDISTSDEMVFAVTPTGLERISFDKYWKGEPNAEKTSLEKVKSDESWKECLNTPTNEVVINYNEIPKAHVHEDKNLLYIDHDIDGYETCLEEDTPSLKNGHKADIKEDDKQIKTECVNIDEPDDSPEEVPHYPYVQEHIIKQMKSLRIEPINVNITKKKRSPSKETPDRTKPPKDKKESKSPKEGKSSKDAKSAKETKNKSSKSSKSHKNIQCIEYYNDQAECLKEIRQRKLEEEERKYKEEQKKILESNKAVMEKKLHLKKQDPSEESTDLEIYPDCHKCFLENYAYAITKAYIAEASNCKYCEVIRDMLEVPKVLPLRRLSAPALVRLDTSSESEDDRLLLVPPAQGRRKSAGPLKFVLPARRPSYSPAGSMTVTERRGAPAGQRWGPPREVTLKRTPGAPLGVSIVGGKVDIISNRDGEEGEEKAIFGIFIKNVVPGSPAGRCGELQTGDRILEVDGVCVRSAPHDRCVELIKAAGDTVTLTVQSLLTWNTDSSDVEASSPTASPAIARKSPAPSVHKTPQHEITITVTSEPDPPPDPEDEEVKPAEEPAESKPEYSDSESSDEEDERELQGRTYSDKGVEIDRASAGAVKRSKEEKEADPEEEDDFGYTTNKLRKKYGGLGDSVLAVRLERGARGLGLALAGHRDRTRMAVFVCGLHPAGAAAKATPAVKVGDEILEVNGIVLHGRCHLNASAIIKGLVGPVFKIILLRRKSALEDVAVKPLTQFPVALEEESSEDRFAGYKGVRDITVKKGPSGLGIMIIEGRHTEAGRGIFVSDLQEGSAAEQAGLQIGDMLLAVNRDSLLNCSYDAAAAKLKQAEGVVVLTVCSPNMKDDKDAPGGASRTASGAVSPEAAAGGSRPVTPRPAPSPAKPEPPPDPATAPVQPNTDTALEISTNNEVLGLVLLGGSDTHINGATAIILDIYKGGAIDKDGRLRPGDQILDANGVPITKEMAHERRCLTIKQKTPKLKLLVHRPEPLQFTEVEVELSRKPGKPLGITCVAPVQAPGLYLGDMLPGTAAEVDGRLQKGDLLVAVDGRDLAGADLLSAAAALKLCGNKVAVKVKRFKCVR